MLCKPERQEALENIIFANTTSIGIRYWTWQRRILSRKMMTVSTPYGEISVKACEVPDETGVFHTRYYPEYDSVKALALEKHVDLATLYRLAQNAAENA